MENLLFLTHTESDGSLSRISLESLNAAICLRDEFEGSRLSIGLIGENVEPAAGTLGNCGAAAIYTVQDAELGVSRYATDTAALEVVARTSAATVVVSPATHRLARALPGVSLRLGGRIDSRVTGLSGGQGQPHIDRWYYRQRILATTTREHRPWLLLLESGVFEPWQGTSGTTTVERLEVVLPESLRRTRVKGVEAASGNAQTIRPDADFLLVAGAGWTKKQGDGQIRAAEAEALILDFLNHTQASLGGSKSLVDQGGDGQQVLSFMTHLHQVGQTGSTPRHPKGLATCCHGEEPHVVGWRFITERRAINTDPSCSWAQGKADVLYVADAFEVMAKLNELLAEG